MSPTAGRPVLARLVSNDQIRFSGISCIESAFYERTNGSLRRSSNCSSVRQSPERNPLSHGFRRMGRGRRISGFGVSWRCFESALRPGSVIVSRIRRTGSESYQYTPVRYRCKWLVGWSWHDLGCSAIRELLHLRRRFSLRYLGSGL